MNQEIKEKTIKTLDFILRLINYLELDRKLERKYIIEPQYPNKKVLEKIEKALDEKFVFNVPGIPLNIPLRKLMAATQLHKDELIEVFNDLKTNGAITAVDTTQLQKPEMIGFDTRIPVDINKKKLIKYKNYLSKEENAEKILYLNLIGDLYKEPKEKYCYSMGQTSARYKTIKYLIENKGFQPTPKISLELEGKNENSIRKEIGKMNQIIKNRLEIKTNFIEGRKESGYRINPKYKMILKNE